VTSGAGHDHRHRSPARRRGRPPSWRERAAGIVVKTTARRLAEACNGTTTPAVWDKRRPTWHASYRAWTPCTPAGGVFTPWSLDGWTVGGRERPTTVPPFASNHVSYRPADLRVGRRRMCGACGSSPAELFDKRGLRDACAAARTRSLRTQPRRSVGAVARSTPLRGECVQCFQGTISPDLKPMAGKSDTALPAAGVAVIPIGQRVRTASVEVPEATGSGRGADARSAPITPGRRARQTTDRVISRHRRVCRPRP
jgi:hypothetical protein